MGRTFVIKRENKSITGSIYPNEDSVSKDGKYEYLCKKTILIDCF